jgi:hypothetical protein
LKTAYILIDFENVQPKELGLLGDGAFNVMVFVGQAQPTIPVGLASALQALGDRGKYVHIEGRGPNALDMHIAYYIGRLAAATPGAAFHIISRDRDYDPLIRHLTAQRIPCTRWKSVAEMSAAQTPAAVRAPAHKPAAKPATKAAAKAAQKAAASPSPKQGNRVDEVVDNLTRRMRARPATLTALTRTIRSHYRGAGIADAEVTAIIDELKARGLIAVKDGKVTYHLAST